MDRGTKLMFGALTIAIGLMVINMFSNNAPQAYADTLGAQGGSEPTIVWYGTTTHYNGNYRASAMLMRAWSDGLVEGKIIYNNATDVCNMDMCSSWQVISDPNEGLAARSDLNDDATVNIEDLLTVINDWGPAPANMIPPSECPLALILP